jgi:uncharacterized protein
MMCQDKKPFWETKTLEEMSPDEWEMLCDGCAKCCLHKIEDADTGEVYFTRVACRLLDLNTCRCLDYPRRFERVPDCVSLTPEMVRKTPWLPETCAYRRLAEGRGLATWHPLIAGNATDIHRLGIAVCGRAISESYADLNNLEGYVTDQFD